VVPTTGAAKGKVVLVAIVLIMVLSVGMYNALWRLPVVHLVELPRQVDRVSSIKDLRIRLVRWNFALRVFMVQAVAVDALRVACMCRLAFRSTAS